MFPEIFPLCGVEKFASEVQFSLCFKRLGISELCAIVRQPSFPKARKK